VFRATLPLRSFVLVTEARARGGHGLLTRQTRELVSASRPYCAMLEPLAGGRWPHEIEPSDRIGRKAPATPSTSRWHVRRCCSCHRGAAARNVGKWVTGSVIKRWCLIWLRERRTIERLPSLGQGRCPLSMAPMFLSRSLPRTRSIN